MPSGADRVDAVADLRRIKDDLLGLREQAQVRDSENEHAGLCRDESLHPLRDLKVLGTPELFLADELLNERRQEALVAGRKRPEHWQVRGKIGEAPADG